MRWLILPCLCLLAGCGASPTRAPIQGEITFKNGKPLPDGKIRFIPINIEGATQVFAEIKDGRYALAEHEGPVLGKHRVEITAFRPDDDVEFMIEDGRKAEVREMIQYLPARYNLDSQMNVDIVKGTNTFNQVLER